MNHEYVSLRIPSSGNVGVWEQTFPLVMGRAPTVDDMRHDVGGSVLHVRRHEGDRTVDFAYRPLGAGDCQKCHFGEFSRPFDWDSFWPPIKHGKEPSQTAARGDLIK